MENIEKIASEVFELNIQMNKLILLKNKYENRIETQKALRNKIIEFNKEILNMKELPLYIVLKSSNKSKTNYKNLDADDYLRKLESNYEHILICEIKELLEDFSTLLKFKGRTIVLEISNSTRILEKENKVDITNQKIVRIRLGDFINESKSTNYLDISDFKELRVIPDIDFENYYQKATLISSSADFFL